MESGRKTLIERLPEDVAEPLSALAAMLGGRQAESFARRLPAACEACSLRLSSLDRKREKQLVFQHRQALIASLDNEVDPLSALRIATQLLVCTRHNSVVDLPNKGVPDLVAHLVNTAAAAEQAGDDNDKDLAVMALDAYHQQARKYLLCMANGADDDTKRSLQAELGVLCFVCFGALVWLSYIAAQSLPCLISKAQCPEKPSGKNLHQRQLH